MTRQTFIPYQVQRIAESYHVGRSYYLTCPACRRRFIYVAATRHALDELCPACGDALDSIGCIGIAEAVGLIADRRQAER